MKIGARTIKTGLAVTVTIFLVSILEGKLDIVDHNIAVMAAITAIIGMQPSIKGSLKTFKNRVIATFIGTLIALILALTLGLNAFYLGLGSIAIILICLKLELNESITFALITLVAIGTYNNDFNIMVVTYRISGMLIGLTVSTVLNIIFMPPDYTEDLKIKINDLQIKFEQLYEDAITDILREGKVEKETIKDERQTIRDELDDTRDVYSLLIEDVLPKNEKKLKKYRRSINAIQSNLERLTALHRSIVFMPNGPQYFELRQDLYRYLKYLLTLHRQIYTYIALNKDYKEIEENIDAEEIRKRIVRLIKIDSSEDVFEFYNVYFEAMRINEKLEQLKNEFELDF
ncbi:MAG TPA: aromatic acid exporter family protein [Syntrophomonadaceae bacterium]|nr:aromatic acid exporter family protein [Syntrophomonadaceae bacterium]